MDFIDEIRALVPQFSKLTEHLHTEEAAKTSLVMPFIRVLGYNVFDPTEVVPEFTADIGTKKGEKVDYAIMQDRNPIILFECKQMGTNLTEETYWNQLARYFMVTKARFGVLTDGLNYRFFSDLDATKEMDRKPFLEFNILEISDAHVEELKRFTKSSFQLEDLLEAAREPKYTKEIKRILGEQLSNPADDFVKFFQTQVYSGRKTQGVQQQFHQLTKKALNQFISERISDRLSKVSAMESEDLSPQRPTLPVAADSEQTLSAQDNAGIVTTDEELRGYYIVKTILHEVIDPKRVAMRDLKGF